jgi:acylpyruvate hydrolase
MRFTTVRTGDGTAAAVVDGDRIGVLPAADVGALIASGPEWRADAAGTTPGRWLPLDDADLAPLVVAPDKIICVGANYADHCAEAGVPVPTYPPLFAKFTAALIGPRDDLVLPANSQMVDWEAELGVVIGTAARHVAERSALDVVAGYTVVNDASMRDWQVRTSQFLQGKTFEGCTPVGPVLVTPDEVDHALDLRLTCEVDGTTMQDSTTAKMVFPVAEVVAYVSSFITLLPGDLIAMGTPGGVGAAMRPPVFLRPGTAMVTRVDGIGELVNRILPPVDGPAAEPV